MALAGEIVAAVSGEPYDVCVRKHLLEPLGMSSSTILFPTADHERLAVAYGRRMPDGKPALRPEIDTKGIAPAAGLSSTVEDLARYVAFHLSDGNVGGKSLLKNSMLREMQRVHWLQPDWKNGWGIGFDISRIGDRTTVGHGGALAGFRTEIAFSPEEKIGVIVLTNAEDGNSGFYVNQIFTLLAPAIKKAAAPTPVVAQADPEWNKFVGTYRESWGDREILVMNGELVMIDPTADDPKESLLKLVPAGKNKFRTVEESLNYGEIGEFVTFELGADGKVTRMKVGENYTPRLK